MFKALLINFSESIDLSPYYSILNEGEIQKAERFKFKINKAHSVLARFYTRQILSELKGITSKDVNFSYTEFGKPFLEEGDYHFNVSHSGEYILLVISDVASVGADIEKINFNMNIHEIAGNFFTKNEYSALKQVKESEQHDAFYKMWTRKESFIKCHGAGLSIPLHDFEVDMDQEIACLQNINLQNEKREDWMIYNVETPAAYRAAITVKNCELLDLDLVKIDLK